MKASSPGEPVNSLHQAALRQYSAHYERLSSTLDVAKFPRRTYKNMELMYGRLLDRLAAGQAVADLGCGAGFLLHWLSGRPHLRLTGCDLSESQAELARKAVPSAEIVFQDAVDFLEGKRDAFGAVFCMDMLEHLETDDQCFRLLSEVHQALERNGFFVCRVPNAANVLASFHRYLDITHHRMFTSHSLRQAFEAAGFQEIRFLPHRSSSLVANVRLGLEYVLHRALYLLSGYARREIYTENLVAVAFK